MSIRESSTFRGLARALGVGGVGCLLAGAPLAHARELIVADGPGGTYALLEQNFGIEVPDCGHKQEHFTEEMDATLGKFVFVAHAHRDQDNDRCMNTDRQRTEMRGRSGGLQGTMGSTLYYRWKMKLPAGFQVSSAFSHLFQIKAYGNGHGSGAPIMTLAGRSPDSFGIDGRIGTLTSTSLAKMRDQWVLIDLKVTHSNAGRVELKVTRLGDGMMLISYAGNADMWDDGAGYGGPKFGLYRSLNAKASLRDEQVRFADFCISKVGFNECEDGAQPSPPPPSDGGDPGPYDAGLPADAAAPPVDVAVEVGPPSTGSGGSGGSGGTAGSTGSPPSGTGGSSGSSPWGTGGSSGRGGSGGSPRPRSGGSSGSSDPTPAGGGESSGGCSFGGASSSPSPLVAPGVLLLLGALARRRRRRPR